MVGKQPLILALIILLLAQPLVAAAPVMGSESDVSITLEAETTDTTRDVLVVVDLPNDSYNSANLSIRVNGEETVRRTLNIENESKFNETVNDVGRFNDGENTISVAVSAVDKPENAKSSNSKQNNSVGSSDSQNQSGAKVWNSSDSITFEDSFTNPWDDDTLTFKTTGEAYDECVKDKKINLSFKGITIYSSPPSDDAIETCAKEGNDGWW